MEGGLWGQLPHVVEVQVPTEHRADVACKAEGIQHRQQVEQCHVPRVREPRLYGDGIV